MHADAVTWSGAWAPQIRGMNEASEQWSVGRVGEAVAGAARPFQFSSAAAASNATLHTAGFRSTRNWRR